MSTALAVTVAMAAIVPLAPPPVKHRELRLAVATADAVIRAKDANPAVWQNASGVALGDLEKWYGKLSGKRLDDYDGLRAAVRRARGFDRPVTFFLLVNSAKVQPSGALVLRGTTAVRRGNSENFYTRDEKKQIDELKAAIRAMHARHQKGMKKLTDGTEIKRDIIQRHHEAIDEIGDRIWMLRDRFEPAALERLVASEAAAVRVTVPKALAKQISTSKLPLLRSVELVMPVSDFHIRAPLSEYDRPAAIGMLIGDAQAIVTVAYNTSPQQPSSKPAPPKSPTP